MTATATKTPPGQLVKMRARRAADRAFRKADNPTAWREVYDQAWAQAAKELDYTPASTSGQRAHHPGPDGYCLRCRPRRRYPCSRVKRYVGEAEVDQHVCEHCEHPVWRGIPHACELTP